MPVSRINIRKIKDVLRLKLDARMSHQQIAAALGISKGVVTKYLGLAAAAGLAWTFTHRSARMLGARKIGPKGPISIVVTTSNDSELFV